MYRSVNEGPASSRGQVIKPPLINANIMHISNIWWKLVPDMYNSISLAFTLPSNFCAMSPISSEKRLKAAKRLPVNP